VGDNGQLWETMVTVCGDSVTVVTVGNNGDDGDGGDRGQW
jgi:hypothetical protein